MKKKLRIDQIKLIVFFFSFFFTLKQMYGQDTSSYTIELSNSYYKIDQSNTYAFANVSLLEKFYRFSIGAKVGFGFSENKPFQSFNCLAISAIAKYEAKKTFLILEPIACLYINKSDNSKKQDISVMVGVGNNLFDTYSNRMKVDLYLKYRAYSTANIGRDITNRLSPELAFRFSLN